MRHEHSFEGHTADTRVTFLREGGLQLVPQRLWRPQTHDGRAQRIQI